MLSFTWLVFLALLSVAVKRGNSTIGIDSGSCQGTLGTNVSMGLAEMGRMATNAVSCTTGLRDLTPSPCNQQVVLNTFQTYFGYPSRGLIENGGTVLCVYFL
jgi:hypothetical protein